MKSAYNEHGYNESLSIGKSSSGTDFPRCLNITPITNSCMYNKLVPLSHFVKRGLDCIQPLVLITDFNKSHLVIRHPGTLFLIWGDSRFYSTVVSLLDRRRGRGRGMMIQGLVGEKAGSFFIVISQEYTIRMIIILTRLS